MVADLQIMPRSVQDGMVHPFLGHGLSQTDWTAIYGQPELLSIRRPVTVSSQSPARQTALSAARPIDPAAVSLYKPVILRLRAAHKLSIREAVVLYYTQFVYNQTDRS